MKFVNYRIESGKVFIHTDTGKILLSAVQNGIVHVQITAQSDFSNKSSYSVVNYDVLEQFTVIESEVSITVKTSKISIIINKETCAFSYYDSCGWLLSKEPKNNVKSLTEFPLAKTVFDRNSKVNVTQNADGVRADVEGVKKVDRTAWHYKLPFEFDRDEAVYGFGSHEEGLLNLRGHCQYLYQQNMKAVVPVMVSTNGYGIFFDNYSYMTFHDDEFGSYVWVDVADEINYYFLYGPEFDAIIESYRWLTGGCPMLPKSTFGYIQSKERYVDQQEILDTAAEYRRRKIPLDMVVLDWKSWTGELWGQKSFDPERFPDPKGMTDRLHDMNVKFMISIWPIMSFGGQNHTEMMEKDFLLGNCSTYNAFDEDARKLYWQHANEGLFRYGVDAWWCDCTEPFEADWKGQVKPEPEQRVVINTEAAKKYIDPADINAFSLLHSKGIYEGQRSVTDEKRVVNLTRSSYAGQHRYGTITWSGDIAANWETLRKQTAAGLNFCVTGEPYWSLDVGGFFVKKNKNLWFWDGEYDEGCADLGYRELYTRFLQLGAFLPVFRSHGTDTPREAWRFGAEGEPFYDAIVKFIHLRYQLLPYIYSLAGMVTFENYTMMRMLAFDFRNDFRTYDIDDEFMFGPSLLVCPVTNPMYYAPGSKPIEVQNYTREVYLPKGCGWYDFWTGRYYDGGTTVQAAADISKIPVYVKSGSILPLGNQAQSTAESKLDKLVIYPGASSSFIYYEDSGDNYGYENNECCFTKIEWNDHEQSLTIHERKGSFPSMEQDREVEVEIHCENHPPVSKKIHMNGELQIIRL